MNDYKTGVPIGACRPFTLFTSLRVLFWRIDKFGRDRVRNDTVAEKFTRRLVGYLRVVLDRLRMRGRFWRWGRVSCVGWCEKESGVYKLQCRSVHLIRNIVFRNNGTKSSEDKSNIDDDHSGV